MCIALKADVTVLADWALSIKLLTYLGQLL